MSMSWLSLIFSTVSICDDSGLVVVFSRLIISAIRPASTVTQVSRESLANARKGISDALGNRWRPEASNTRKRCSTVTTKVQPLQNTQKPAMLALTGIILWHLRRNHNITEGRSEKRWRFKGKKSETQGPFLPIGSMVNMWRQTHGDPFLKKLAYQKLQRHDDSDVKNVDVTRQQFML